jgi:hypothetical protein
MTISLLTEGTVMNFPVRPLFAAASLVVAFVSTSVLANPIVTAPPYTPNHGVAGDVVRPQLKITEGTALDDVDFSVVLAWDFLIDWDETVLEFDPTSSTMSFGAGVIRLLSEVETYLESIGTVTSTSNSYYMLSWVSDGTILDLGTEINFEGSYRILAGAAPSDYLFDFEEGLASSINDENGNGFTYSDVTDVTQSAPRMMVTVDAPTVVPEPGMVGLLLGGLGAYLGAMRLRRRAGQ